MKFADVQIIAPGPAVQGTRILVDGVEQENVYRAVLDLSVGSVARLALFTFPKVAVEGSGFQVETVPLCPACKKALDEAQGDVLGVADITTMEDAWRKKQPAAPSILDRAIELLKRQPADQEAIEQWLGDRVEFLKDCEIQGL
jgi:hypothetical protein